MLPALYLALRPTPSIAKSHEVGEILNQGDLIEAVKHIEQSWEEEYEEYFGRNLADETTTVDSIARTLLALGRETGKKPALLYMLPSPDGLKVILVTEDGPIHRQIPEANRETLLEVAKKFRGDITNPRKRHTRSYLENAQQLYQWAIAPIESALEEQGIETLVFCVGSGLRSIPFAALHDGEEFLVEKYSMGQIPAFKLVDTLYGDVRNSQVLAMGASEFQELPPLPAVPVELSAIVCKNQSRPCPFWQGQRFLNQGFTLEHLKSLLDEQKFQIVHLATHAEFLSGDPDSSYIQLWDSKLTMNRMGELDLGDPPLELLVLSACKTAIGDKEAELGFGGLAVNSGVKSALASLWYVSDSGTLALMAQFYRNLQTAPIKAEALRQAQLALIREEVSLENGELRGSRGSLPLPPELRQSGRENLSHPYYWAAFTMIGSPW
ncbi:MAG: CHAT domain-containing protein [Oscillatoria sp. SIO1A7]|nr:CHAT domain-containing protein [Oscillatoria sp. SIO1A7]